MPRQKRIARGNVIYHVLNGANGKLKIFKKAADLRNPGGWRVVGLKDGKDV